MAKKKIKRRKSAARRVVVQLPARRNPRRKMPKRNRSGQFVKGRTSARRVRRNPIGGALIVNPARKPARKAPRKMGIVKGVISKAKRVLSGAVLIPLLIGGTVGVLAMAAFDKWLAPVVGKWNMLGKAAAGLAMIPALNKVRKTPGSTRGAS